MKSQRLLELEKHDQEMKAIKLAVNLFNKGSNAFMSGLEPSKMQSSHDKSVNEMLLQNSVMASGYQSGYKSGNFNTNAEKLVDSQRAQNSKNDYMLFGPTGDNLDSEQLSD